MTPEKAKSLIANMKPRIVRIVANYEQSSNGDGMKGDQEDKDNASGRFNLDSCIAGNNKKCFLQGNDATDLLYWWHVLEDEGTVPCLKRRQSPKLDLVKSPRQCTLISQQYLLLKWHQDSTEQNSRSHIGILFHSKPAQKKAHCNGATTICGIWSHLHRGKDGIGPRS
jgi:hypothetical protein